VIVKILDKLCCLLLKTAMYSADIGSFRKRMASSGPELDLMRLIADQVAVAAIDSDMDE